MQTTEIAVQITSDGSTNNTRVIDLKSGDQIGAIQKIIWEANVNEYENKCTIELLAWRPDQFKIDTKVNAKLNFIADKNLTKEQLEELVSLLAYDNFNLKRELNEKS